jgi:hypothetical protein
MCRWAHIYGFSALFQCCVRCPKLQNFWIGIFYVVLSWRALHYNKRTHNCVSAHTETGNSFEPQTPWFSQLDSGCWDTITKFKLCATSDSFHVNTASKQRISPTTYSQFVKHVPYTHIPQTTSRSSVKSPNLKYFAWLPQGHPPLGTQRIKVHDNHSYFCT